MNRHRFRNSFLVLTTAVLAMVTMVSAGVRVPLTIRGHIEPASVEVPGEEEGTAGFVDLGWIQSVG